MTKNKNRLILVLLIGWIITTAHLMLFVTSNNQQYEEEDQQQHQQQHQQDVCSSSKSNTTTDEDSCVDEWTPIECAHAVKRGMCVFDRTAAAAHCRKSCWKCVTPNSPPEVVRYASTDWGPVPYFPNVTLVRPQVALTKQILIAMDVYARQLGSIVAKEDDDNNTTTTAAIIPSSCRNDRPECAYWAASEHACEHNLHYMMEHCPLACRYCHALVEYQYCHVQHKLVKHNYRLPAAHPNSNRQWKHRLLQQPKSTLAMQAANNNDDEYWAIRLDDWIMEDDQRALMTLAQSLEWEPSSSHGYDLNCTIPLSSQTNYHMPLIIRRTSQSAYCSKSQSSCWRENTVVIQTLLNKLGNLLQLLSLDNWEKPLEFVRHSMTSSFAPHCNYRQMDGWKSGSFRVMSVYINLQGMMDVGFPDADYTIVSVPSNSVLLWPTVGNQLQDLYLRSELLAPHLEATLGMYLHVRMFPHDETLPPECR